MRSGFTTGSCGAAAAKAAAYMLLTGQAKEEISIATPKGVVYHARIEDIKRALRQVSCAVRKDGGDDPDITTGTLIYAQVTQVAEMEDTGGLQLLIDGGPGVGRVTRPGLDQPVGQAAINRVPREMIAKEVREVCMLADFHGTLQILLSVPEGERLAAKTFNPRLGITGGISILGTTGIVEPMSTRALRETIRAELRVLHAAKADAAAVSPGNYGLAFMKQTYGFDLDQSIKCSNYIGETIDMAAEIGFRELLLTGHVGKLVKLSGGIMNTHSREGDCRMELLAAAGIQAGLSAAIAGQVLACQVTEEALALLEQTQCLDRTMRIVMSKACVHLNRRAAGRIRIECMMYANAYGKLAKSSGAEELLERIQKC